MSQFKKWICAECGKEFRKKGCFGLDGKLRCIPCDIKVNPDVYRSWLPKRKNPTP